MNALTRDGARFLGSVLTSVGVGLLLHTAHPAAVAVTGLCPAIWIVQRRRLQAYVTAVAYYAAALWPAFVCVRALDYSALTAVSFWIAGTLLVAMPWSAAWTQRRTHLLFRVPVAGLIAIVPPLGIIGLAAPVSASGYLFPHFQLFGLAATMVTPALLPWRRGLGAGIVAACIVSANAAALVHPIPSVNWQAVNVVGAGAADALSDYESLRRALSTAEASRAQVIVFPEAYLRSWTPASATFFDQSIRRLAARRKTLLIGAIAPIDQAFGVTDFAVQLATLRGDTRLQDPAPAFASAQYRNVAIVLGGDSATYEQRVPVPFGMWQPIGQGGVRLNLAGAPILTIAGQRAAILICYEQLIAWPAFVSGLNAPTIVIGIANDVWVDGTCVPELQRAYLRAWARLLGITFVAASAHVTESREQ